MPGRTGHRRELVVGGEVDEARVVDGLAALPAQHHRLLAVVLAAARRALEAREGVDVAVHQRMQPVALVEAVVLARRVAQRVAEGLQRHGRRVGEGDRIRRPVALGHLPGLARRRLEARLGRRLRADAAHQVLDHGVAAGEALLAQDLEDPLRGDVRVEPRAARRSVAGRDQASMARREERLRRQRRVRAVARAQRVLGARSGARCCG